jgi:hypothetical protein
VRRQARAVERHGEPEVADLRDLVRREPDVAGLEVAVGQALHDHPAAPVLRTTVTLYDDPADPLVLEAFTNIADPDQQAEFAALAGQASIRLLFYDEALAHRLTKPDTYSQSAAVPWLLEQAARLRAHPARAVRCRRSQTRWR